jgi:hypothetical protein
MYQFHHHERIYLLADPKKQKDYSFKFRFYSLY